ncbi:siderophore-interacting protein [Streptomyces sp. DSM 44915]|uniref:Siderophore-interacting protein n=1 Tax=Streptomyces chisholmiae TaxID=3075540 RepID=A0ABU2JU30_9ACTN|nr:siderophore-interacting protein [Streptomyces sp. DSM 44915]MDT0268496.1 siderophore-interacting protein [Streptomyces sp. DSM 44915]
MGHGWEGAVLRLMRGRDFRFTVTDVEQVTDRYRRVRVTDGGLLAAAPPHPAMWVRLWFDRDGRPHQRAFTLVDPDPATGTFGLEFALHSGAASAWARAAVPGDTIDATLQGSGFEPPEPAPGRLLVVGDPAALPAINSLLAAHPETPATLWFEVPHPEDRALPFGTDPARHDLRLVEPGPSGDQLVERVRAELPALVDDPERVYAWVTCDTATTRALGGFLRRQVGLPRRRVHALGYWRR